MAITNPQRKRTAIAAVWLFAVVVFGGLLPLASKRSNCGGNSAARTACSSVGAVLSIIVSERRTDSIDLSRLTEPERALFDQIAGLNWLGDANVLVRTIVDLDSSNEVVIAVCDRAFRNVPRKLFGQATPTHAALYHNRGIVLISAEEFNRLDLTGFVDVRNLAETSDAETQASNLDQ